jgi:hypothetical protein
MKVNGHWDTAGKPISLLAVLTLLGGVLLQTPVRAGAAAPPRPAISMVYLTTDQAYDAFDPRHGVAPPAVTHFPRAVQYVAIYFSFKAAKAGKTTFHVNFLKNNKAVRRGEIHPLSSADGTYLLDLPGTAHLKQGKYQAAIYLDAHRSATTDFWIEKTPIVRAAYLIGPVALARYNTRHPTAPTRSGPVKAGTKQVGVYLRYGAAKKGTILAAAVYDHYGRLAATVPTRTLAHAPTGAVALALNPSAGKYSAGTYRIDISLDGAVAVSIPWKARKSGG